MSTTTLELPDELAERLNAFATSRGLATADALEALLDEIEDEEPLPVAVKSYRLTAEGVAAVEEALEEIAAGKCHRFDLEAEKREARERSARIAQQSAQERRTS